MKNLLNVIPARLGFTGTLFCTAFALAFFSVPAAAQDADEAQAAADDPIEEIIAVGVRRSLEFSLQNKRNADSIIDGIAAEGIGKFPDLNLAESLSRITGVQIDTSGPSGERREGQVALRGLPNNFAKTLVNGQTLATPNFNGGFSFGIFESDVVAAVNVVKSPTAKYDEGGLSGIIDIKTLRPLSIGQSFATVSVEADYEGLSEDVVPNGSFAYGDKFLDDTVGVFASFKWSDQSFRTDTARINGYDEEDTDGDGLADLFEPNEIRHNSRYSQGDRISFAGGVEFQATDDINIGVLGIYSAYELPNELNQFRVRARGNITDQARLVRGGRFGDTWTEVVFPDGEIDVESRIFDDEFETYGVTADIEWSNDFWTATGVLHYSSATFDRFAIQSRRNIDDNEGHNFAFRLDTGAGDVEGLRLTPLDGDWADPAHYSYGANVTRDDPENREWRQRLLSSTGTDRDETETALQFDLIRHFDGGFITSVEGGLKYRMFEQDQRRPSWSTSGLDFSGIDDLGVMVRTHSDTGGGFFGGNLGDFTYLVPDWQRVRNQFLSTNTIEGPTFGGFPLRINNNRTFNTDVDISSAYAMFRFDGANLANSLPVRGNIGVRYVQTDRDVKAFTISDLLSEGEQRSGAKVDFSETLPSVNVIWDINDDLMLRLAWYEAMVRPNAQNYRADSSVDVDWLDEEETIPEDIDIELGNPALLPFTADAWDMSLEWYNRAGSGVSVAYFQKDIVNGIEDRILCPSDITSISSLSNFDFTGVITGQLTEVAGICQDEAGVEVFIEDAINNKEGFKIDGWEIGVLQNFDFLDNWLSGFGVRANYTYIDTSEGPDFDSSGNRLPLENVSEKTYNLITYYEQEDWGVRLAYNYRSEYFLESGGSFIGEDRMVGERDRLDLSGSWRPMENLRIQAEIFNLTNETRMEYQGVTSRVRDLRYTGRTFTMGATYRF